MGRAAPRSATFLRLVIFQTTVLVAGVVLPVPAASLAELSASGAAADSVARRPVTGLSATGLINAAELRDPFFRFTFGKIATDSVGVWTRADLDRYITASGEQTRLPLARIVSIERRVAVGV